MEVGFKEFDSNRPFGIEVEVSASSTKEELRDTLSYYELFRNKNPRQVKMTAGQKGWEETKNNNYWHVKYDSTCGSYESGYDHGWEIASYIGSGLSDISSISNALHFVGSCAVDVNQNCGLHVHVEVVDFNTSLMGLLLDFPVFPADLSFPGIGRPAKSRARQFFQWDFWSNFRQFLFETCCCTLYPAAPFGAAVPLWLPSTPRAPTSCSPRATS